MILLSFYFHEVSQHLKTFYTNFRFQRVLRFAIKDAIGKFVALIQLNFATISWFPHFSSHLHAMWMIYVINMIENSLRSMAVLGNLSRDVFERRTSTGSEAFSLFIRLDANKFVEIIFFSLIKTIYWRIWTKPLPIDGKSQLPVDVRPLKTLLLKLPFVEPGAGAA